VNNTFIRKVNAERRILTVINYLTPGHRQLTGLSSPAIESWRRIAGIEGADRIANRLLEIGVLCQCLSDRSNESFQSLDPTLVAQINQKLRELAAEAEVDAAIIPVAVDC
jgi:hypothetical protein